MGRLLRALLLGLGLAAAAQAAVVWTVVTPQLCTGASAPVFCCLSATPADNTTSCNVQMNFGHLRELLVTFNPDGGGYTNSGTYSTSGDTLSTTNFKRLGFDSVVSSICDPTATKGYLPIITGRRGTLRIHLINPATGAETANATAIAAGASANTPGEQFDCLIFGY